MIHVRLPEILTRDGAAGAFTIAEAATTIGGLVKLLNRQLPGLAAQLDQGRCNFAVNDVLVRHGVRQHPLMPGDTVEIVPTISGGTARCSNAQ